MLPTCAGDVSPEFLTSALRAHHPDALVTTCRPGPLIGQRGMASSLVRLQLDGTEIPASLIGKFAPADPGLRAQLRAMGFFEREVFFYRSLAGTTPVGTPMCYFADVDPNTGDAFLLLEDLSPLRNGSSVVGGTVEEVTATLLALARMHARWWQDAAVVDQPWSRLPSMLAPSAVTEVYERSWPSFLAKLSDGADEDLRAIKAWISSRLHEAATTLLETGPRTLIHNDVQGDNLFYGDESGRSVIFIDWQLVTSGRGVVDVAALVRSGLEPAVRRQAEPALVALYHDALVQAGVRGYPLDQCQADYDLATVLAPARLASAVGLQPGLQAHPGAPWDSLFLRLADPH